MLKCGQTVCADFQWKWLRPFKSRLPSFLLNCFRRAKSHFKLEEFHPRKHSFMKLSLTEHERVKAVEQQRNKLWLNSPPLRWKRCCWALRQLWDSCWRRWVQRLLLLLHRVSSLSPSSDISPKCVWSCSESPGGAWTWGEKMCRGEAVRTRISL